MRVVKFNSSAWAHERWPERASFAWRAGFGAFSVSRSNVPAVAKYIDQQKAHHRKVTFQEEFIGLPRRHEIDHDERYLWV
jgi:putative transposase